MSACKDAANGQIVIDAYSVVVGHTVVQITREGGKWWRIASPSQPTRFALYPDDGMDSHNAMVDTAVEFARRLDAAGQAHRAAARQEDAVYQWLSEQVYRDAD